MNRGFVIALVLILGVALVYLTQGVRKASPTEADEQQAQEQAQQQAQKDAEAKQAASPAPMPSGVLAPEETVGNPAAARKHISVGWIYTEENVQKPETLTVPLKAVRDMVAKSGGMLSAEIVDLDVPAKDRSPAAQGVVNWGIDVDGKPAIDGDISGQSENQVTQAVTGAAGF